MGIAAGFAVYSYYSQPALLNDSRKRRKKKPRIIIIDEDDEDDEDYDDEEDEEDEEDSEEKEERERKKRAANKPPLSQIFNLTDFEYVAKQILPPGTWGYYSTGSDDEFSLRENHYAFGRIFFRPKCLVDVQDSTTDTDDMFGKFQIPIYITAFAGAPMAHPDAEKNLIKAAAKEKIPYMVPWQCSFPLDDFMKNETKPDQEFFHQIHFYDGDQLKNAPEYLKKIETEIPKVKALFINVDLPVLGNREKDNKVRASLDGGAIDDLEVFSSGETHYKPLTWDDLDRLNRSTKLPICLKGVLRKEDVLKAAQLGLAGVVISNHGGRQLDFAMPPIEILAQSSKLLKENNVDREKFKIFIDGGIRRGSDVVKAICLGASGVGLGRPFAYAMATYGQPGCEKVIRILKEEMGRDMRLLGVNSVKELNEDLVDITSLKYKGIVTSDSLYNENYMRMPGPPFKK
ncbi:DEKNAAC102001 [Brettanomyces naardenensis]|uniref:DEKNAAC102001 n=1 Tax=Brettanomyces naardenensis TaxID=13370 RepID=A0A448YJP9_BRENA|nr:DEKNAAC102001 [Brettanomyces naardenensis]